MDCLAYTRAKYPESDPQECRHTGLAKFQAEVSVELVVSRLRVDDSAAVADADDGRRRPTVRGRLSTKR